MSGLDFCGLALAHRVINASGTFDAIAARRAFGDQVVERFPFAAYVTKTVTLEPRQGNPPPRLWEIAGGLINSIGLPNKGLREFTRSDLPLLAELPVPLIVSVMGFSRHELAHLAAAVGERDEVAMVELNVSCPDVETGLVMGADPAWTRQVFGVAFVPDLVLYLDVDVEHLVPRVLAGKGMDYWESGMHLALGSDIFDSFERYQRRLLDEYDRLADEFGFLRVDARRGIDDIQGDLRTHIAEYLARARSAPPAAQGPGVPGLPASESG